jgi:hypothetical protein
MRATARSDLDQRRAGSERRRQGGEEHQTPLSPLLRTPVPTADRNT